MKYPYVSMVVVKGGMIEHIPKDWASRIARAELLGLINMPHFGRPTEVNACVKQLLACFHGRYLWLDESVVVTMELISAITRLPKDGPDPSQYIRGKDNDKKLAMTLKKRYALEHDERAYRIDSINDRAICIDAKILARKVPRSWMR